MTEERLKSSSVSSTSESVDIDEAEIEFTWPIFRSRLNKQISEQGGSLEWMVDIISVALFYAYVAFLSVLITWEATR